MKRTRRSYSKEFKVEAVRLLETSGKLVYEIENELGIGHGCLTRWKQKLAEEGNDAFPGHGRRTADQERIRELERENTILRQERDILKKAVAIFSHAKQ